MQSFIPRMLAAAVAGFLVATGALAQDFPTKPIKLLVGYVPGGGPDTVARALGQKLAEVLGQPIVIDNRPGAGGALATGIAAKSQADGYTLLLGETGQLVIAPFVQKNLQYDTLKDLAPIARLTREPLLIVAHPKTGFKSIQDAVREAKAHPRRIAYGSSGVGTIHHIAGEVFRDVTSSELMHVPYKGSGQSVPAVLAGDVPLLVTSFAGAGGNIRAGKLNLLAVTSPERLPGALNMPNVPALSEFYPGYDFQSETGLLAPAGVPPSVLNKLSAAVKQVVDSPDFAAKFKDTATVPAYLSPADYTTNLRQNMQKYEHAVNVAKIKPE